MIKFSIIIPTYKRNQLLLQAIDSIEKYADSDNVEIIIVDDDPTSSLQKLLVERLQDNELIKYFRNPKNQGPGFCRRLGLSKSHGTYIIFMDDDDFYTSKNIFLKSDELFKKYPKLSLVGFNSYDYLEEKKMFSNMSSLNKIGYLNNKSYLKNFMRKYAKPQSTFSTVFKKRSLINAGALNVKMLNDTIIYLRALLCGDAYLCNEYIGAYRVHDKRITGNVSEKFILENLKEKELICQQIPFNKFYKSKWLVEQTWVSVAYLLDNNSENEKLKMIDNWYLSHNLLIKCLYLTHKLTYKFHHIRNE